MKISLKRQIQAIIRPFFHAKLLKFIQNLTQIRKKKQNHPQIEKKTKNSVNFLSD